MSDPISDQDQFCICCNTWGPAVSMQPLYRFRDPRAEPCLWLHHDCAEICANVQFEAAMKRFESQVDTIAKSQPSGVKAGSAKLLAQVHFAEVAKTASISLIALSRARAALERSRG